MFFVTTSFGYGFLPLTKKRIANQKLYFVSNASSTVTVSFLNESNVTYQTVQGSLLKAKTAQCFRRLK